METLTLLLASLLLQHLVSTPIYAQSTEDLKKGVVRVTANTNGKTRIGTGFVVRIQKELTYIVTAGHVIEDAQKVEVEFYTEQNRFYPTRIIGQESGDPQGLAVLLVEKNAPAETKVLRFSQGIDAKAGDAVTMIGFPRIAGVPWAVTKGEVVGRKAKALVFSGAVDEGSSGGPLIKGNQIIGVVTEMTSKFVHATPALIATYVLEGYGVKFGARLRERPASLKKDEIERLLSESKNFRHEYEAKTIGDDRVIIDHATALMWQRTSSLASSRNLENALKVIAELNTARFAGFRNWRLPTSEEVISLLEERGEHEGQFLSDVFENESIIWTSDKIGLSGPFTSGPGIAVRFDTRSVEWDVSVAFVRAVRSTEASGGSSKDATSSSASVKPASRITTQAREITGRDGAPMVLVLAGEFTMGSRNDDKSAEENERPAHIVYLDAYYIDQYEVTTSRYATFFQETKRAVPKYWPEQVLEQHGRKPIIGMDWNDAQAYCAWAGKRLPTEAEWEKAARGTYQSLYPWGNEPSSKQRVSFYFEGLYKGLTNVGSSEGGESPYGAYDMAGSVWEWTADWYDEGYYGKSPKRNPQGPSSGEERVLRGGSCNFMPCDDRSAFRFRHPPSSYWMGNIAIGFRCAQDVPK